MSKVCQEEVLFELSSEGGAHISQRRQENGILGKGDSSCKEAGGEKKHSVCELCYSK